MAAPRGTQRKTRGHCSSAEVKVSLQSPRYPLLTCFSRIHSSKQYADSTFNSMCWGQTASSGLNTHNRRKTPGESCPSRSRSGTRFPRPFRARKHVCTSQGSQNRWGVHSTCGRRALLQELAQDVMEGQPESQELGRLKAGEVAPAQGERESAGLLWRCPHRCTRSDVLPATLASLRLKLTHKINHHSMAYR